MTDLDNLQRLYEEADRETRLGNNEKAKAAQDDVIDGCRALLEREEGRPASDGGHADQVRKLLALTYNNRGHLKYLEVDFDQAVVDYTEALQYDPDLPVALYNRGLIHYRLGRFAEAVSDQQKVLALQPDFKSAQMCLFQAKEEIQKLQPTS